MRFDDAGDEGEADTDAANPGLGGIGAAHELLEDLPVLDRWDADAFVTDAEQQRLALPPGKHMNRRTDVGIFASVFQ